MALVTSTKPSFQQLKDSLQERIAQREAFIDFDADSHQYYHTEQNRYFDSVSSVIEKISSPFPRKEIAEQVSTNQGVAAKEVVEGWLIRRNFSSVRGQEFHLYAKVYLEEQRKLIVQTPIHQEIRGFHKFYDRYFSSHNCYRPLCTEFIVYNEALSLAGTVDCLLQNNKGEFILLDWKTSKKIHTESPYHRRMLGPLADIEECELSRYSLQLSIYKELIRHSLGISIASCFVVQLTSKAEFKIYKCRDLSKRLPEVFVFANEKGLTS